MTAPQPLSYWARTLDNLFQAEHAQAAEAAGVDRGQWQVLTRLKVGAVADDVLRDSLAPFVVEGDSADAVVDRVLGDGLVEHRANEYRLTERGQERIDEVEAKAVDDLDRRAFDGLSQEERDRLLSTLERVATNLGWQPA